jgi:hypothetical protein
VGLWGALRGRTSALLRDALAHSPLGGMCANPWVTGGVGFDPHPPLLDPPLQVRMLPPGVPCPLHPAGAAAAGYSRIQLILKLRAPPEVCSSGGCGPRGSWLNIERNVTCQMA